MLENLFQLIKEQGQEPVVNNPAIPNEHNEAVLAEASQAVAGTMQDALANGQAAEVQQLFQHNSPEQVMSNPLAQNMQGSFIDSITSKLGISKNVAMGIGASLIPVILSKLIHRTNSTAPQDSGFSLPGLIGSLAGGGGGMGMGGNAGGFDIGSILSQFTGGSTAATNGGSGFNMPDIFSQVTNGARQQQQQGGLQDLIKGFFGR